MVCGDIHIYAVCVLLAIVCVQAMVHELLSLNNNRVSLKGAPGIKPDLDEVSETLMRAVSADSVRTFGGAH
eukprot:52133-Eustigmatos_ZCMA.PRE.1